MATNISDFQLGTFILRKVGASMNREEARELDIDNDLFNGANTDEDVDELSIEEILDNEDLYEMFATMYVEEHDNGTAKSKEQEKEEQTRVGGASGGKTA